MFEKFFEKAKKLMKNFTDEFGEKVTDKCPSCGGQAEGTTVDQNLTCPYCGTSFKNSLYTFARNSSLGDEEDDSEDDGWGEDKDYWNEMEEDSTPIITEPNAVYAYIEKSGMFYNGDIPSMSFARAMLCDSYEECLEKLQANFEDEKSKAFYEPPTQDLEAVRKKHPKAKFIRLF